MRPKQVIAVAIAVVLAFGLGLAVHPFTRSPARHHPPLVAQIRAELATRYYRPVAPSILARPTVEGILAGLHDTYTRYLGRGELRLAQRATREGYSGVGLTLFPGEGGLLVTRTQPGPAKLAGIRPGDTILAVDGVSAAALSFDEALGRVIGREGSTVQLRIRRARHVFTLKLVRRRFLEPSVHARLVRAGVGLIRIDRFSLRTAGRTATAARSLERQGAKTLVLDLRGNPGGLLTQAVGVASIFLDEGATIASLSGRHRPERLLYARGGPKLTLALVVLVDHGSASASEVVAAALRDHGRAVLVGEPTYGKSLVQQVAPLPSGGALKLTVASYRTPSGLDISRGGVRPNIRAAHPLASALHMLAAVP